VIAITTLIQILISGAIKKQIMREIITFRPFLIRRGGERLDFMKTRLFLAFDDRIASEKKIRSK
jgi:hypothetical protein